MQTVITTGIFLSFLQNILPLYCLDEPRAVQQRILSIKRNVTNLESILRKSKDIKAFYAAPQTCRQVEELLKATLDLDQFCEKTKD